MYWETRKRMAATTTKKLLGNLRGVVNDDHGRSSECGRASHINKKGPLDLVSAITPSIQIGLKQKEGLAWKHYVNGSACPHKTVVLVFGLPLTTPDRTETTLASGEFGWQDCYVYSGYSSTEAFQGVRLDLWSWEVSGVQCAPPRITRPHVRSWQDLGWQQYYHESLYFTAVLVRTVLYLLKGALFHAVAHRQRWLAEIIERETRCKMNLLEQTMEYRLKYWVR